MPPERHKRCLGCGYDLRRLPENRCPECGRAFDLADPETYLHHQGDGRKHLAVALLGLFGMTAPIMTASLLGATLPGLVFWWAVLGPFSVGLLTTAAVLGASIRRLREPPAAMAHRSALVAALLVSALPYIVFVGWAALGLLCVIIERVLG
jgi:hypothetical protein